MRHVGSGQLIGYYQVVMGAVYLEVQMQVMVIFGALFCFGPEAYGGN